MTQRHNQIYVLLTTCFVGILPLRIEACPVCMVLPTRTAADDLIASETIVFAREDPNQPFRFKPVESLKGEQTVEEIELFVDSSTRRRLKANPNHVVVLTCAGGDAHWRSLGIADDDFRAVIRRVLTNADQ